MIVIKNIEVSFSGAKLFSGFSAEIESGQNVCFSGGSGKGKSTLLKILQGYVIPQKGSVLIDGQLLTSATITQLRSRTAWIPQNVNLPVNNCMELMHLMEVEQSLEKVKINLELLGLNRDFISKDFSQISGGEKQRIIIAVCFSQNKDIILMDEPTSSLDDESIDKLIDFVKSSSTCTIVTASHNAKWLQSADKIIKL